MNKIIFEINCFLRKRRLRKSLSRLNKSTLKLKKAREERIWIENNMVPLTVKLKKKMCGVKM